MMDLDSMFCWCYLFTAIFIHINNTMADQMTSSAANSVDNEQHLEEGTGSNKIRYIGGLTVEELATSWLSKRKEEQQSSSTTPSNKQQQS